MRGWHRSSLLLVGAWLCLMAWPGAKAEAQTLRLLDFETQAEVPAITAGSGVTVTRSGQWQSTGRHALKLDFQAFDASRHTPWPGVRWASPLIKQHDWQGYRYLSMDLRIVSDDPTQMYRFTLTVGGVNRRFNLEAGDYRVSLSIPDNLVYAQLGGQHRGSMKFTTLELGLVRPATDVTVYVDHINLASTSPHAGFDALLILEKTAPDRALVQTRQTLYRLMRQQRQTQESLHAIRRREMIQTQFKDHGYGVMAVPAGVALEMDAAPDAQWKHELTLDLMQGERRSRQVVVWPDGDSALRQVAVEVGDLRHDSSDAKLASSQVTVDLVGYVRVPVRELRLPDGAGDAEVSSWRPDPLLRLENTFDVTSPRKLQPVLVTVHAPEDAPAGQYSGVLRVMPHGMPAFELPVRVTVHDVRLPTMAKLSHLTHIGRFQAYGPQSFLDYRLNPNTIELGSIYRQPAQHGAIDLEALATWRARGMSVYNLAETSRARLAKDAAAHGETQAQDRMKRAFAAAYSQAYMQQLKERGLAERGIVYGFDEIYLEDPVWQDRVKHIFGFIKQTYGDYGVRTAMVPMGHGWIKAGRDLPIDILIPGMSHYTTWASAQYRQMGKEVWWYHVGWEVTQPPVWSRQFLWDTYAVKAQGWLYYNFSDWNNRQQRLGDDPMTDWQIFSAKSANLYGTGALFYEDAQGIRPSLRIVNFRDGMTDYDLLWMLEHRVKALNESGTAARQPMADLVAEANDLLQSIPKVTDAGYDDDRLDAIRVRALELLVQMNKL